MNNIKVDVPDIISRLKDLNIEYNCTEEYLSTLHCWGQLPDRKELSFVITRTDGVLSGTTKGPLQNVENVEPQQAANVFFEQYEYFRLLIENHLARIPKA